MAWSRPAGGRSLHGTTRLFTSAFPSAGAGVEALEPSGWLPSDQPAPRSRPAHRVCRVRAGVPAGGGGGRGAGAIRMAPTRPAGPQAPPVPAGVLGPRDRFQVVIVEFDEAARCDRPAGDPAPAAGHN